MNANADKVKKLQQLWERKQLYVMSVLGNEAVNFFIGNFQAQGFRNYGGIDPWHGRKYTKGNKSRSILVNTGKLRRSIHVSNTNVNTATVSIGSEAREYAAIHNYGGIIIPTMKMRRFFWAMYKKEIDKRKSKKAIPESALMWKRMALAKKITIPQRRFMGPSTDLDAIIIHELSRQINLIFKS